MSVQSTSHIWQYTDLDENTTSICCVDKKQVSDFFNLKIKDIELETKCVINLHGLENQNSIVWIRIKNSSTDARRFAILLINSYTNNSCKEIVLPKLGKSINSENPRKAKKTLTRSCTEHSVCSLSSNTPFSSILSPLKEESSKTNDKESNLLNSKKVKINVKEEAKKEQKKRYTKDFLLTRSAMDESKKLPKNWKELNLMYPNICFVGTVLSYFNATKYHDHWIRLQNENPELHNPVRTISNMQYLNLNQDSKKKIDNFMNRDLLNKFEHQTKISKTSNKNKNAVRFITNNQTNLSTQSKQDNYFQNKNQFQVKYQVKN
ncbi:unnamed protein product [Brachionus calyciflorus]|uniref:Uncharacterized protein n=1 Tax=Brachionus calyciflorus TaxID=104777 RepID=A0A814GRD9_9BILA|nr:unnamed protein product [Brachionus calyciflorus]